MRIQESYLDPDYLKRLTDYNTRMIFGPNRFTDGEAMKEQKRGQQLYRCDPNDLSQEPLDGADRDAILDLEKSPGYVLLFMRVQKEIERKRTELEQSCDIDSTQYIRGVLYGMRLVLKIPEILKAEI